MDKQSKLPAAAQPTRRARGAVNGIGGPSIIMIFAVLCLTVFSVLTLVTANNELKLAKKYAASVDAYYVADSEAERVYAALASAFSSGGMPALSDAVKEYGAEMTGDSDNITIAYTVPVTGQRSLNVTLSLSEGVLKKTAWYTSRSTEWQGDEGMNVWDGN